VRYIILTAGSEKELVDKVNDHIDNGWRPQGGVSVRDIYPEYYQAMIR
jgi:hypothetical protein